MGDSVKTSPKPQLKPLPYCLKLYPFKDSLDGRIQGPADLLYSKEAPVGCPKEFTHAPPERICLWLSFTKRSSPRKLSQSRKKRKKQPQLRQSHLTDPSLPSHFSVLNTPEEKSFIKGRMGKCPWIRPFHFLIPSPFSQSLVADGRKRKIEVGYKLAQPDV